MLSSYQGKEVFIISSNENFCRYVKDNLPDGDFRIADIAVSCTEARQKMIGRSYEVVLINIPLSDESGTELSGDIAENTSSSVISVVKNEMEHEVRQYLEPMGVFVLGRPFPHSSFHQVMFDAASAQARMKVVSLENQRLQTKLLDMKVINRAKMALIQYVGMDENTAHKYIEQQAMNQRISRRQAAENVLKTYQN